MNSIPAAARRSRALCPLAAALALLLAALPVPSPAAPTHTPVQSGPRSTVSRTTLPSAPGGAPAAPARPGAPAAPSAGGDVFRDDPDLPRLGAIPCGNGSRDFRFRVWVPDASSVELQGDFNHWKPHDMHPDPDLPGVWTLDQHAKAGDAYQFLIDGYLVRRDPQARAVRAHDNVSIVVDPRSFRWPDTEAAWRTPDLKDLVFYEMHLGTFTEGIPGNDPPFIRAIKRLSYLKNLGINAIQLMPVNEFTGDRSWGYNPGDLFAIESSYGSPDDFRTFVAACHANGIAVVLDIVHNHYGPQDLAVWHFDRTDGDSDPGCYFYSDPDLALTEWGPRPDFSRKEVREFIASSVRMFVEEYHVDGFRWDSVYNIRYVPSNGTEPNPDGDIALRFANDYLQKRFPRVIRIAEDHAFDGNGVGFHAQWNSAFQTVISSFLAAPESSMDVRAFAVVLHDLETRWVQFAECHDSAGDLNNHHRLAKMLAPDAPKGVRSRSLSLLANAIALTVPGTPMFLQGLEINDPDDFSDGTPLPWGQIEGPRRGLAAAHAGLVRLRRNLDKFTPGLAGDKLSVLQADNRNKVIVFMRYDSKAGVDSPATVVLMNFSGKTLSDYSVRLPAKGIKIGNPVWYCLYNSSLNKYDKEFPNVGPAPGTGWRMTSRHAALPLEIPPWGVLVFSLQGPRDAPVKAAAIAKSEPLGDWTLDASDDVVDYEPPALDVQEFIEEIIPPFPYRFFPLP